jgi:hypothetical protein
MHACFHCTHGARAQSRNHPPHDRRSCGPGGRYSSCNFIDRSGHQTNCRALLFPAKHIDRLYRCLPSLLTLMLALATKGVFGFRFTAQPGQRDAAAARLVASSNPRARPLRCNPPPPSASPDTLESSVSRGPDSHAASAGDGDRIF